MIIVKLAGGLGNQMFQFAAGRALALKHGTELVLDTSSLLDRTHRKEFTFRDYELDQFSVHAQFLPEGSYSEIRGVDVSRMNRIAYGLNRFFHHEYPIYHQEYRRTFDERYFQLPDHVYLEGYWQSEDYFRPFSDALRKSFTFIHKLDRIGMELSERMQGCPSVCLNVRRGTYITNPSENRFHGVCSIEYYHKAVEKLAERFPGITIFIFSDDPGWCKEHLPFPFETVIVDDVYSRKRNGVYLDLMSRCKHFIISNSTFGWWGAWLSSHIGKTVIAPIQWYRDRSMDTSRLIPNEWIRI